MTLRFGVLGNNLYGQAFARAASAAGASVVAIAPELDEATAPFASEHGLAVYPNLAAMLAAEGLDAVLLGCVTSLHEGAVLTALAAGAHVLVDRPLAISLEAADRMIEAAAARGRTLMVAHVLQFWPEYVAVREIIQRGDLGRLQTITASRVSGALNPGWQQRLLSPEHGLGGLEAHVHDVEFLCSLLGRPHSLIAQGTRTPAGAWQQVHSLLRFADGCSAGLEADYGVPLRYPLTMYLRVVGEAGALQFTFRGALAARQGASRQLTVFPRQGEPYTPPAPAQDAYTALLATFIASIQSGQQPPWCRADQARLALEVLLAIANAASQQSG